jgi:hypothetical protein
VSSTLLDDGADALAECVEAAARALAWQTPPLEVVATGGLASDPNYRARIRAAITRRVPHATVVAPRLANVVGAAMLALEVAGLPLTAAVRAALSQADGVN